VVLQSAEDRAGGTAYAGLLLEQHVNGLIVSGPRSDDAQLSRLHEEGYPLVLHGHLPDCTIPFVDVDNVGGAQSCQSSHWVGAPPHRLDHQRPSLIYGRPRQTDGLPSSLGFDDIFFTAYVSPPLTTVRLPA
jgi:DNA-binding LacI/PurR family transcriptional regulator